MPKPELQPVWQLAKKLLSANKRTLSGLVLTAVLTVSVLLGMHWLSDPYRFPLSVVEVKGDFKYQGKEQLQLAVMPCMEGGFFTVDVAAIREAAEQLPWVHKASVQRIWPATLRLEIEEQQPVARWGSLGFLNSSGESFTPEETSMSIELPALAGPAGQEKKVLEYFRRISEGLAPLELQVTRLELDNRRALHVELDGGTRLELGKADYWQRLQRFVRAYENVFAGRMDGLMRVDLRYSNGFSVFWQQMVSGNIAGRAGKEG